MRSQIGDDNLHKSNIHKPTDLLQFPWEKEPAKQMSDKEIEEMQAEMKMFQELMHNERQNNPEHDNVATAIQ